MSETVGDGARPMASFVKLLVNDVEASARFYEALGFERAGTDGVFIHLRWRDDGHLYLVKTPPGMAFDGKRGAGVLVGFAARDVDGVAARAASMRAAVEGPRTTPWHTREIVFADPDGYRLNFAQPG